MAGIIVQTQTLIFMGYLDEYAGGHPSNRDAMMLRNVLCVTNTGRLDTLLETGRPTENFGAFRWPRDVPPLRIEKHAVVWSQVLKHPLPGDEYIEEAEPQPEPGTAAAAAVAQSERPGGRKKPGPKPGSKSGPRGR